jgi:hypothetical protein
MARRARYFVIAALCVVLVASAGAGLTLAVRRAQASGRPGIAATGSRMPITTCDTWSLVASPNTGAGDDHLSAVSADAATDVWAVGQYVNSGTSLTQTLIEHYNGNAWSVVSSPNATGDNFLNGVAALSATDVWAVGFSQSTPPTGVFQTLIEHWDGNSWSVRQSANTGSDSNVLNGIAAISATDIWAVGYYFDTSTLQRRPLVEHWDGTTWTTFSVPGDTIVRGQPSPRGAMPQVILNSIVAISATDIWAVGTTFMHWDGTTWTLSTWQPASSDAFYSITASATNDVWAVGSSVASGINSSTAEHWDGMTWNTTSIPVDASGYQSRLAAAAADPALHRVLAVGYSALLVGIPGPAGGYDPYYTLAAEWDGTRWSTMPAVNPNNFGEQLLGVASTPAGDAWAVGDVYNSTTHYDQTLIERYAPYGLTASPCASH